MVTNGNSMQQYVAVCTSTCTYLNSCEPSWNPGPFERKLAGTWLLHLVKLVPEKA